MAPKILAEPSNLWSIPAAVVIALLYFLSPILAPFAAILACISNPLLSWIERHRVPRALGAMLVGLRHLGAQYRNSSLYKI
jgi:predicted PurR-regulated permease PerM